ncbi:exported hypothetical protein [Alphaproteobacteria bacterium]
MNIMCLLMTLLFLSFREAFSEDFSYIEGFKNEAKSYIGQTSNPNLIDEVKQSPKFNENPQEANLDAHQLRSIADDKVKGIGEGGRKLTEQEQAERDAINAAKASYKILTERSIMPRP